MKKGPGLGFLKKYLRQYGKLFAAAVFFLTIEAVCDLLQPTIMAQIVDRGVAAKSLNVIWQLTGLMLLTTAVGAVAAVSRNLLSSRVSQRFGTELRFDLFTKIQTFSFENLDRLGGASLVTRLTNDVTQVQVFANGLMRVFVKAPLVCLGAIVMSIRLNPEMAVVLLVVLPIVTGLVVANLRLGFPFFMKVQKALDRLNGVMREYLSGVRVVKAFNRFGFESERFERANQEQVKATTSAMRVLSVFAPGISLTVNLGIVAVLWFGGLLPQAGGRAGQIIALVNYMTQILFSLMLISMVFTIFVRARASTERIAEVFAENNTLTFPAGATARGPSGVVGTGIGIGTTAGIVFRSVGFAYPASSGVPVLQDLDFTLHDGETLGLIGSTGSGKSTLVGLIPRFYNVTAGRVEFDGVPVAEWDQESLRRRIALVPQKTLLFTGSIRDNILWGKEGASLDEVRQAAVAAAADDFISAFPEGYDTVLGQGGVNLSGGQKQRIALARALIRQPEVLILDDCTSAVDAEVETRIRDALRNRPGKNSTVLIAQKITSVLDCDRVLVLDEGRIAGLGPHAELLKTCTVYQDIFRSQLGPQ